MKSPFAIPFDRLPETLPLFPLPGVLLLPGGVLPLNLFERRYLNMALDALAADRLIGMVQPDLSAPEDSVSPALFKTGCAGRVTSFMETGDGRLLITLTGVCRFDIEEEVSSDRGYRRAMVHWARWRRDIQPEGEPALDLEKLKVSLGHYFAHHRIAVDWAAIEKMPSAALITFLAMNLPFEPSDKQLLLEAPAAADRARLLITLTGMAAAGSGAPDDVTQH